MTLNVPLHLRGGGFLLAEAPLTDVVTPEDLDAEAREIGRLAADFARQEVLPRLEALEAGEHELSVELLRKAGELGLLAGDIPAAFGGLGLSKATTTLI
ncbi:MAG TPA: acyl-CoA dehydrogenase family protein, partial [Bacillota bacterium]